MLKQDITEVYWRTGFYVFEGVVQGDELDELVAEFEHLLTRAPTSNTASTDAAGRHRKELTYSGFQPPFVIPPVQIRTCAANASGSCFESDAQTLPFGAPCLNRSLILPASEFRTQEGKQNSSQPSPFAPQAPLISFALLLSANDLIVRRFIATTNLSDFLKT